MTRPALPPLFLCLLSLPAVAQTPINVMPAPARLMRLPGEFTLDASFQMSSTGYRDPFLEQAAMRLARILSAKSGLSITGELAPDGKATKLRIRCNGPAGETTDESYTLTVRSSLAELRAPAPLGVLRGLATFFQLLSVTPAGATLPAVTIEDRPRFQWRGLMIDVARHYMPLETLLRQIDAMEVVKLNVLHLHLSDDQGFRVESKAWPKLTEAGSDGQFYTQDEIRRLVDYARERGVRVVPEFDVPGHTKSWLAAYPELASKPGPYHLSNDGDNFHATLDPSKESVYEFIDRLFGEMAELFPDRYFHVGGDEVTGRHWAVNAGIQAFMKEKGFQDRHELQAYFMGRVREMVHKRGKVMIGWDEVLRPDLPADVAVESWRSSKMTARSAIGGHPTIVAGPYYLDFVLPAGDHYSLDPLDSAAFGLTPAQKDMAKGTSIAPYMTDERVVNGPTPMTPEQERHVLGGEAALWTELVTVEMLDGRLWPRTAAIAERFWSPKTVRDPDSMYQRLAPVERDLEVLGLRHRGNGRLMLDRFAPGAGPAVSVFAEAVEPIKFYGRHGRRNRPGRPPEGMALADAVPPENLAIRQFEREVKAVLANRYSAQELRDHVRARLTVWRDNAYRFSEAAKDHPSLREFVPLSQDLEALSQAGVEALLYWEKRQRAPAPWIEKNTALIAKHKQLAAAASDIVSSIVKPQPASEVILSVVPGIEQLVKAASR